MSQYFTIDESGKVHDLPECECCGAPLYRPGLCAVCAEAFSEVDKVTEVSQPVVIPSAQLWEPADFLD